MFSLLSVGLAARLGFDLLGGIGLLVLAGPARGCFGFDRFDRSTSSSSMKQSAPMRNCVELELLIRFERLSKRSLLKRQLILQTPEAHRPIVLISSAVTPAAKSKVAPAILKLRGFT